MGPLIITRQRLSAVILLGGIAGCAGQELPDACRAGEAIREVVPLDAQTVRVAFNCRLDAASAAITDNYQIADFALAPPARVAVTGARVDSGVITLTTAEQTGGVRYTLRVDGVRDAAGNVMTESANFVGGGRQPAAPVTFVIDDTFHGTLKELWLLASFDPATGIFTHRHQKIHVADVDGDHRLVTTLDVAIDPRRTVETDDDSRGAEHIAYNVRAVDAQNRPLTELVAFAVIDGSPQTVELRLLSVPPLPCPEGLVPVTVKVDDRPAAALERPSLKGSFDRFGAFDANFPTEVPLSDDDGDRIWEVTVRVRIQCGEQIVPYSVFVVEDGTPREARSADFTVTDAAAKEATILVGNPDLAPVTFRVDVGQAWLDTTGDQRGLYAGEAIFLTGEFGEAEDAFGANASDAFSGGENTVLQMRERSDRPGVWQRTVFMKKDRPAGWKVVRCPANLGCGQLNKLVTSSGRAFPTVMKNLVTEQCDAAKQTFTDPNCLSPRVVDPRQLDAVDTGQGTVDYSGAQVYPGSGAGGLETDPPNTPNAALLFKQEIPDLVVDVGQSPLATPVYLVGTWRDVNIPGSPAQMLADGTLVDLGETDYDAGLIGAAPPSYDLPLHPPPPPPPPPPTFQLDGQLDNAAQLVAGGSGTMPIYLALAGDTLYLATDDAGEGSDNFLLLAVAAPGAPRPAPWGKNGSVALGGKVLLLADENDGGFAGWFELGDPDLLLAENGSPASGLAVATGPNGGVLEGTVDLKAAFGGQLPTTVYLAAAPWNTVDGGPLYAPAQTPASQDGDGDIDADEILAVSIPSLEVLP